jgi:hypothetical protein
MNKSEIKLIEREMKSVLTIGEKSKKGFTYTRNLIEEVIRQQEPMIKNRTLFVTIGFTGRKLSDTELDKIEGVVTGVRITEDNKVAYTIQFLEKIVNLYASMNIPMSIEIPILADVIDNKYLANVEATNYIDVVFDNPKETMNKVLNAVEYIKELSLKLEVK